MYYKDLLKAPLFFLIHTKNLSNDISLVKQKYIPAKFVHTPVGLEYWGPSDLTQKNVFCLLYWQIDKFPTFLIVVCEQVVLKL